MSLREPRIFTARTAEDVERVLRGMTNSRDGNFRPSHIIDVSATAGVDLIGDWHLSSEGGDATVTTGPYGDDSYALRTVKNSATTWTASDPNHFNWALTAFAFLIFPRFNAAGSGGFFFSNFQGPADANPFLGGSGDFGTDRGYGMTSNGDGGIGFQIGGDTGWLNTDTSLSSVNLVDSQFHALLFGLSRTANTGFLRGADFYLYQSEHIHGPGDARVGTPGNTLSSDGMFAFRADYNGNTLCGASMDMARIIVFEGDAAENIYTFGAVLAPQLQNSLALPDGTVATIRATMLTAVEAISPLLHSDDKFRRHDSSQQDFAEWCETNPASAFRRFHIRDTGDLEGEGAISDVEWTWCTIQAAIAYPKNYRAGEDMGHELDDLIASDMRQIRATIGLNGYASIETGVSGTVESESVSREEGDACLFGLLTMRVGFWSSTP